MVLLSAVEKLKAGLLKFEDPLLVIAGIIFFLVLIVAGFVFMAGGTNGKETAKQIVIYDVIGLVIVLLGREFANEIISWFGGKGF